MGASTALSKRQRVEWGASTALSKRQRVEWAYFPTANTIFQLARQREIVNLDECPMEF